MKVWNNWLEPTVFRHKPCGGHSLRWEYRGINLVHGRWMGDGLGSDGDGAESVEPQRGHTRHGAFATGVAFIGIGLANPKSGAV